ncbi:MAG: RNA polymerase sigma factor [Planctomycetota bacterium]
MIDSELALLNDDALVERARRGERVALEALLERHAAIAVAAAYSVLGNRDDALDAAQTALMQVAQHLTENWSGQPFKACLYVCAHNTAVNLLAQNASRKRREQSVSRTQAAKEPEMPDDHAARQEMVTILREELAALPAETAASLSLYHLEGLPVADQLSRRRRRLRWHSKRRPLSKRTPRTIQKTNRLYRLNPASHRAGNRRE